MRHRWSGVVVIGALAFASLTLVSCGEGRVICDYAAPAGTFVGPLLARHGSTATFRVERVGTSRLPPAGVPVPTVGEHLAVHYWTGAEFLRVGRRYLVTAWPSPSPGADPQFDSGIHVANEECSTGTTYADGSAIDTALVHQAWLRRALIAGELLAVVVGVPALVFALRRRRRQRRNTERLLEARRIAAQRSEVNHG